MDKRLAVVLLAAVVTGCGGETNPSDGGCAGDACTSDDAATDAPADTQADVAPPPGVAEKVDLLFMIDNSASMADKQGLLASAVPTLVGRLLNPNCVDADTSRTCASTGDCASLGAAAQCDASAAGGAGQCFVPGDGKACSTVAGTKPEFAPVHDMHLAIVSSSLGGGGSPDICGVTGNDATHQDDRGHLLNRTVANPGPPVTEGSIANAKPIDGNGGNFLAWLPSSDPKNSVAPAPNVTKYDDGQESQLETDFASLVNGVQQHGCGLEAQLESWYRFLIQPDPYASITLDANSPPKASLTGVDATLLKMRHDFLRPDSVVAVVMLTDEEDSWSDPLWNGGFGWVVRTQSFPGGPGQGVGPRETSACDAPVDANNPTTTGPNDPNCSSCALAGTSADPNCTSCAGGLSTCPMHGWYNAASTTSPIAAADGLNVRYGSQYMKKRYGLDPQFNVQRYVDGLSMSKVPDRDHDSHDAASYAPTRNCTNPLFAASLPDGSDTSNPTLCNLALGPRTPGQVFFAILGGVPNALVDDANGNLKLDLSAADWTALVGKDPAHYLFDGIDPHMIESVAPRNGLQAPGTTYGLGSDPDNGREWNTLTAAAAIDLEYACTFDLPAPKDCTSAQNANACDCTGVAATAPDGPPVCSLTTRTTQIKGKAYPTIRELRVAQGLGSQALVASICAKDTKASDASLPSFGYEPAMNAFVDRIRGALAAK